MRWSWGLPYPSRRQPVLADQVVATSQPLAAQAGLEILRRGGNAVDAAVGTAMALTVVEPTSNGIGGDLFAMLWDGSALHGLNSSGRAPAGTDVDRLLQLERIPYYGWDSITVPGMVAGWVALWEQFGRLELSELVKPAAAYARRGFRASPWVAEEWAHAVETYQDYPDFAATFLPGGRAPRPGERVVLGDHADSLELIAQTRGEAFYRGPLAERMVRHAAAGGAALAMEDLALHQAEWVEPVGMPVGEATVWELPPNCQGIVALTALGIIGQSGWDMAAVDSAETIHWQIEAMKLALADGLSHIADPASMTVHARALLEPAYLRERAGTIDPSRAAEPLHGRHSNSGTVYVSVGDADGVIVSLIQSNYANFGSGIVVPGTGIALQNRGAGFSTQPDHPNVIAPGKRPFHTLAPAFATVGEKALMAFGMVGGPMQPQGHVQVTQRTVIAGQNPQAALDALRWRVDGGRSIAVEDGWPPRLLHELASRGHEVTVEPVSESFGDGQVVAVQSEGGYLAACDHHKDGQAVGF